jgi:hypothetical protein
MSLKILTAGKRKEENYMERINRFLRNQYK